MSSRTHLWTCWFSHSITILYKMEQIDIGKEYLKSFEQESKRILMNEYSSRVLPFGIG